MRVCRSGKLAWLSARAPGAIDLDSTALRTLVASIYAEIGDRLAAARVRPLRVWNYLPDPGERLGPELDRYMVFNAGRHDGLQVWLPDANFETGLPTATAVGTPGGDLVVHCLASEDGGRAVHNPRQRQPWTYSTRYGPRAPSFSRGVVAEVAGRVQLMIGGTASILGEDSVHIGDASAQVAETLENMAAVISTAADREEPAARALARLDEIRVYLAPEADEHAIRAELGARLPARTRTEARIARLCRPELLVEIEGVAALPSR